jgi:hypothetical protein
LRGSGKRRSSFGTTDHVRAEILFSAPDRSGISAIVKPSGAPLDPPSEQRFQPIMDHIHKPPQAAGLPGQVPHLRFRSDEPPAEFFPMRLLLQPAGATVDVDRPDMVVGRHTEADIRLPLPDVSRRHCRLQFVAGGWQVVDLNSLNGTKVNGEAIQQAALEQGDLLRIGGFTFAVELHGATSKTGGPGALQSILETLAHGPKRQAS